MTRVRRQVLLGSAAGIVLAGAGGLAYGLTDQAPHATRAADLVAYVDGAAGYQISHPTGWTRAAITDGTLFSGPERNAISIKKVTLAQAVDGADLQALRAVTDAVLGKAEAGLTMLRSGATRVGGLPAIFYVYQFPDGPAQGVHTHYFAFRGRTMYTLVLQALPAAAFERLAPTFDAVAESFQLAVN